MAVPGIRQAAHTILNRMWDIVNEHGGLGLAAPQIGCPYRIIIINQPSRKLELINPKLTTLPRHGRKVGVEACLSFPDLRAKVKRWQRVKVHAVDRNNEPVTLGGSGINAVVLQHEIDHLNGITLGDRAGLSWETPDARKAAADSREDPEEGAGLRA